MTALQDVIIYHADNCQSGTECDLTALATHELASLQQRAEAAEARAAQAEADKWRVLPDENGDGGETWRAAFADCDMQRMSAEVERDEARRQLSEAQHAIDVLSNTVVAQDAEIKRLNQAQEDVAEYRAEIERLNQAETATGASRP